MPTLKHRKSINGGSRRTLVVALGLLTIVIFIAVVFGPEKTMSETAMGGHVHSVALHPNDPDVVYLGTHRGLFVVRDGKKERVGESGDDFMGLAVHQTDPNILYGSGHSETAGENLGLIVSLDAGETWEARSDGIGGPVDFHFLFSSPANPNRLYGVYEFEKSWQVSDDGGFTWRAHEWSGLPLPISFVADPLDVDTIWASTIGGLYLSEDAGVTWVNYEIAEFKKDAVFATAIHPQGISAGIIVYTENYGILVSDDGGTSWQVVGAFDKTDPVLYLLWSTADKNVLYALTRSDALYQSQDAGRSWALVYGDEASEASSLMPAESIEIGEVTSDDIVISRRASVQHEVPFTAQAPLGEWGDVRQQNACEEASVLMAVAWARGETFSPEQARSEILGAVEYQETEFGHFHDTSLVDTAERIALGYFELQSIVVRTDITAEDVLRSVTNESIVIVPVNGMLLENPYYTSPGPREHMVVVTGYDNEREEFIVNDPGTRRGNDIRYSYSVFDAAIQNYASGYHEDVLMGSETAMMIVWADA